MTTPDAISGKILATLKTTIPSLSCEVGTPERKIVDACAEAISEAYIDQYLVGSLLDIDTKSGLELEQFVGIFGFGRLVGQPAQGVVRITVNIASTGDNAFQLGTQFYTQPGLAGVTGTLYFASTQATVLPAGQLSCDIPVQCTVVGTQGNVPPDSITYLGSAIGGSTVTNQTAMTGGIDTETDAELRQRFKDTLMRNVAGTADFYEAICQQNTTVSRVKVFGPLTLYVTQLAVPSPGPAWALPVHQDVKYAWPEMMSCFSDLGTEDEVWYSPVDDYVYGGGVSPTFTTIPTGVLNVGDIVDLEFQYTTRSSRNDPLNGITNKVDIFTDGISPLTVTEHSIVSPVLLNSLQTSPYYTGNFERVDHPGAPVAGNRFTRLGSVPIVSFPPIIVIGGVIYSQGVHYYLLQPSRTNLNQNTLLAGSPQEIAGIEWDGSGPATNTELTLNYVYNQTPELLTAVISNAKQITTDVMVHQAEFVYIQPCLSIEYDRSYSVSVVNTNIINRLQQYFAQLPFGAQVKLSNICMFTQQTLGVVDTKVTLATDDPVNYGVQIFDNSEDEEPSLVETGDFKLLDNQLANYQGVIITRVAAP